MEEKKKNYRPPGWLITRLPELVIDRDRAQKLEALREKMCDTWGEDNQVASLAALQLKAIDLLLSWEGALLTKVELASPPETDGDSHEPICNETDTSSVR